MTSNLYLMVIIQTELGFLSRSRGVNEYPERRRSSLEVPLQSTEAENVPSEVLCSSIKNVMRLHLIILCTVKNEGASPHSPDVSACKEAILVGILKSRLFLTSKHFLKYIKQIVTRSYLFHLNFSLPPFIQI